MSGLSLDVQIERTVTAETSESDALVFILITEHSQKQMSVRTDLDSALLFSSAVMKRPLVDTAAPLTLLICVENTRVLGSVMPYITILNMHHIVIVGTSKY